MFENSECSVDHFKTAPWGPNSTGQHHHQLATDKDRSDLHHGLKLVPKECDILYMHGFFGGRSDHFLMNLGEVFHYLKQNQGQVHLFDHNKLSILAFSKGSWNFIHKGIFSIFSFVDNKIKLSGNCKFNTVGEYTNIIGYSSHGLSNEASGLVTFQCENPLLIFLSPNTTYV